MVQVCGAAAQYATICKSDDGLSAALAENSEPCLRLFNFFLLLFLLLFWLPGGGQVGGGLGAWGMGHGAWGLRLASLREVGPMQVLAGHDPCFVWGSSTHSVCRGPIHSGTPHNTPTHLLTTVAGSRLYINHGGRRRIFRLWPCVSSPPCLTAPYKCSLVFGSTCVIRHPDACRFTTRHRER